MLFDLTQTLNGSGDWIRTSNFGSTVRYDTLHHAGKPVLLEAGVGFEPTTFWA
jgi:hypothetical protein